MFKAIINFFKKLFGIKKNVVEVQPIQPAQPEQVIPTEPLVQPESPVQQEPTTTRGFGLPGFRYPEPGGINYTTKNSTRFYLDGSTYDETTGILNLPKGIKYDTATRVLSFPDGSSLPPYNDYLHGQILGRIMGWKFNLAHNFMAPAYGETAPLWVPITKPTIYDGPGAFGGGSK